MTVTFIEDTEFIVPETVASNFFIVPYKENNFVKQKLVNGWPANQNNSHPFVDTNF